MMKTYTAIFEHTEDGSWSAHIPELPTILVAGADTFEEAKEGMEAAIELHIQDLKEQGLPFPGPSTEVVSVEVLVPFEPA